MSEKPSYKTHDPKGWGGDPRRGAALGRGELHAVKDPATFDGRVTLQRKRLNSGGYDVLGTYWGFGMPLYWYAYGGEDGEIDATLRAPDRAAAKAKVRERYPRARFW